MRKYNVTYLSNTDEEKSTILEAWNKTHLAMVIVRDIKDMKDNNADNIIKVELVCNQ